jgi:Putative nuclease YbcO
LNLRKLARNQPCLIRVPEYCTGGGETTVLCHIRLSGVSGMGIKAPDILGAFGCHACHSIVDGQRKSTYTKEQRDLMLLQGMARTQYWLIKEGYLKC